MATKSLRVKEKMNLIYELKQMGIPQSGVEETFTNRGLKPPSKPTIRKYYNKEESVSTEHMAGAYAKEKAFDEPQCKGIIIRTLTVNGSEITVSSVYDLLQEKLVDTGLLEKLPGNEQTLRNYCRYLKEEGIVTAEEPKNKRIYDEVTTPKPGLQMQLDYGVQVLKGKGQFHFIALLLRHSRVLFVKAQDHRFNATETCNAIYAFFMLLGGRVVELVIDQDACLVYEEKYGEVTTTAVFKDFLMEQDLKLFVCRKADPQTKGPIENTVKYVKQNYLPSRMDWSLQELAAKIPEWCKRKNSRIHATELWKIDDHFEQFEKNQLLPLLPSQYDRIGSTKLKVSVSKTRQARYKTNRYTLPRDYYQKYVWIKTTSAKIMFYTKSEEISPFCSYDLPSDRVKNQHFEHEIFKKKKSTAYRDIYDRVLTLWYTPTLKHYLNGLYKEHENSRFLREQFKGFETMLKDRKPSVEELEDVMDIACKGYRYKLSQLDDVWNSYLEHNQVQRLQDSPKSQTLPKDSPDHTVRYEDQVEKRDTAEYNQIVSQLSEVE